MSVDQLERLRTATVENIAHGVRIPGWVFAGFVPGYPESVIFDYGGAEGVLQTLLPDSMVVSFDINKEAIRRGAQLGRHVYEADVTNPCSFPLFGGRGEGKLLPGICDAVVMRGLLCNIAGEDGTLADNQVRLALLSAKLYLAREGVLIIGDMLRIGEPNHALDLYFRFDKARQGEYVRLWNRRYRRNRQIGLPSGTFIVTEPGDPGEWGALRELRRIQQTSAFERYARHFRSGEIGELVRECGFEIVYYGVTACPSRSCRPLSQFVLVARPRRPQLSGEGVANCG